MKKVYINGLAAVSTQKKCRGFLENNLVEISKAVNEAIQPEYTDMIPSAALRRMAKGVKMGIFASQKALDEAKIAVPEAIVAGTGMGCLIDSGKFLTNMVRNEECYLTPTAFVQSTYNTVVSQISLRLQCKGHNFTYVNKRVSFESALMDALLLIQQNEFNNVLVGAVDEIEDYTRSLLQLLKQVNVEGQEPFPKGVNLSEGASFFALSNSKTETTYAELVDVHLQNQLDEAELIPFVAAFLEQNKLLLSDIDVLVLGTNQSGNDLGYYSIMKKTFPTASVVEYKHFVGEYDTVSAFGFLLANEILKNQSISEQLAQNLLSRKEYKNILLYNQFDGFDHSLVLLSK